MCVCVCVGSYLGPDVRHDAWVYVAFLGRLSVYRNNTGLCDFKSSQSSKAEVLRMDRNSASRTAMRGCRERSGVGGCGDGGWWRMRLWWRRGKRAKVGFV